YLEAAVVALDDRPGNRQAHAHAVRLGREQRIENAIDDLRVDSLSGVRHGNQHAAWFLDRRFNTQDPGPLLLGHPVDRVGNQIYQQLLQLNPISLHRGQALIQFDFHRNAAPLQLALRERENFTHEVIEVEQGSVAIIPLDHRADAADEVSGTVGRIANLLE